MAEVFNTEVSSADPQKREGGLIRPVPAKPEVIADQEDAASIAKIFATSIGSGAVGTVALTFETPATSVDINRGRQIIIGNRVRNARTLSPEEFNTLSKNIVQSQFTLSKKIAFMDAARAIRSGLSGPDEALAIVNIPERDENIARSIQQGLNKFVETNLNLTDEDKATFTAQVGSGLGSAGTFILTRFIPGIGQMSLPAFAALVGSGEAIQRATAAGADDEEKSTAALLGLLVGTTDIIPINRLFKPFTRIKGFKGAVFGFTSSLVKQGAIEGTQEAVQEFLQNAIAKLYNPNQSLLERVEDQGIVGFVVGALLGAGAAPFRQQVTTQTAVRDKIFSRAPIASDLIDPQTRQFLTTNERVANIRLNEFTPGEMQNLVKEVIETSGVITSTALDEPSIRTKEEDLAEARRGGREQEFEAEPSRISLQTLNEETRQVVKRFAGESGITDQQAVNFLNDNLGGVGLESVAVTFNAIRTLSAKAAIEVFRTQTEFRNNRTIENQSTFNLSLQRFESLLEIFAGGRADIGRALRIQREPIPGVLEQSALEEVLIAQGITKPELVADMLDMLQTPEELAMFVQGGQLSKPGAIDMAIEFWLSAMLLSNPSTYVVNTMGNTAALLSTVVIEPAIAAGVAIPRRIGRGLKRTLTGDKGPREPAVTFREVGSNIWGMIAGTHESLLVFGRAALNEDVAAKGFTKVELPRKAIPDFGPRVPSIETPLGTVGGFKMLPIGQLTRLSFRVLGGSDLLFKTFAWRARLQGLSARGAYSRNLKGLELRQYMKDFPQIVRHTRILTEQIAKDSRESGAALPEERVQSIILEKLKERGFKVDVETLKDAQEVVFKSIEFADYTTFTKSLGETGQAFVSFIRTHPGFRFPFPFVRTPINLAKFSGERGPQAILSPKVRQELFDDPRMRAVLTKAFKAGKTPESQEAVARIIFGSGIMLWAWALAGQGLLTGSGPGDTEDRAMLYSTKEWQPNSLRINTSSPFISFGRIEPFAILGGTIGSLRPILSSLDDPSAMDLTSAITVALTDNLVSKTWLTNIAELAAAINDPERYGERYLSRFAASLVIPRGAAALARTQDPILRKTDGIIDSIINQIPFKKEFGITPNKPIRDRFGEIIAYQGSLGPDIASPLYITRPPENKKAVALQLSKDKIGIGKLNPIIQGVDLLELPNGDDIMEHYEILAGTFLSEKLTAQIGLRKTPDANGENIWDNFLSREEKVKIVKQAVKEANESAQAWLFTKYPEVFNAIGDEALKKLRLQAEKDPILENLLGPVTLEDFKIEETIEKSQTVIDNLLGATP